MHNNREYILVTGAGGLLGSHLITTLLSQHKKIKALYRSQVPVFEGSEKVEWIKGDILDVVILDEAMQDVGYVYHCAAVVSFNPKKRRELFKTNVEGTSNVVNACLTNGIQKLIHVSSVAALGRIRNQETINETMQWSEETSNSEYGKSKHLAELEVWRGIGEGLQAAIVNPAIILGAGDWSKGSSEIFKSAYDEFPWYTEGVTGFVDVQDVVKAMIGIMESPITAQRFIISAENLTYHELFTMIAKNFGKKPASRKVTPFIAALVWRWEAVKAKFTGKGPMLTKETAATALAKVYFDNTKLPTMLSGFKYNPITVSVERICAELKKRHKI